MIGVLQHDSFFGFLNFFKRVDGRQIKPRGERPPYPIILPNATVLDVIHNMNLADLGMFSMFALIGLFMAKGLLAYIPARVERTRRLYFNAVWTSVMVYGVLFALENSFQRLTGHVDNGLLWKRKENTLRKYDFTSEFEEKTIFKHIRLREQ